jgi:hypothetical protein
MTAYYRNTAVSLPEIAALLPPNFRFVAAFREQTEK